MPPTAPIDDDDLFGDGLPDEEQDETSALPPPPPQTTTPAPPPSIQQPPRKKRPYTRRQPPANVAATPTAPAAPEAEPIEGLDPQDAMTTWPCILEEARAKGMGPEYFLIRIQRTGEGLHPTPATWLDAIEASMVAGNESVDAGQMLVDYVTNAIHLTTKGPAKYRLYTILKGARGNFTGSMTIRLGHPDDIRMQRRAKDEYFLEQQRMGFGQPGRPPRPQQHQQPMPLPPPPPMPPQQPTPVGAAPTGFDFFDYATKYEQWRNMVAATGAPMPPPAPAPPPQVIHMPPPTPLGPRLTPEETQLIEEAKFTRFLEKGGYVKAGVGAPVPPAAAAQAAQNPVSAIKELLGTFKAIQGLKGEVGELFGVTEATEEEPEKPAEPEGPKFVKIPGVTAFGRAVMYPQDAEGIVEKFQQAIIGNPETTMDMALKFLGGAAKALDGTKFGQLLERVMTQQANPAAAEAAAAAKAQGMIGTGAPNGAPMVRRSGPQA